VASGFLSSIKLSTTARRRTTTPKEMIPTMKPYRAKRRQALQVGASPPPPPNNNCKGSIDSVISGSLLIYSQVSSDAGNEDSNNNSTPGIRRPTNDNKTLIEEKSVYGCLGLSSKNRLIFISNDMDNNEDNSAIFVRIQWANLRRFDKYKKRLCLTTAPLWNNCKIHTLKQECIDIGWVSIPYHLLLYTLHLWSCRIVIPDLVWSDSVLETYIVWD
jgi:hypothetical protein